MADLDRAGMERYLEDNPEDEVVWRAYKDLLGDTWTPEALDEAQLGNPSLLFLLLQMHKTMRAVRAAFAERGYKEPRVRIDGARVVTQAKNRDRRITVDTSVPTLHLAQDIEIDRNDGSDLDMVSTTHALYAYNTRRLLTLEHARHLGGEEYHREAWRFLLYGAFEGRPDSETVIGAWHNSLHYATEHAPRTLFVAGPDARDAEEVIMPSTRARVDAGLALSEYRGRILHMIQGAESKA